MGLNPQVIGKEMPHGFAGGYARQPDMIVNTRPAGGTAVIPFGQALKYDDSGNVIPMGAAATAAQFVGVAGCEIKSTLAYLDQSRGQYAVGEPVSVFMRGSINVKCNNGSPKVGGDVYVRVTANESFPNAPVGGFEAVADSTTSNTIKLTNCQWGGSADANGVAELVILTRLNA